MWQTLKHCEVKFDGFTFDNEYESLKNNFNASISERVGLQQGEFLPVPLSKLCRVIFSLKDKTYYC